ncbi:MAG TPA: S-methyl-5-thioribose-1-phosphate isomerase [bacterium]|nr:S-methyl-5-thioribose-1-phosphate isomerase [bacterium]HPG44822.1 S-methyl-5-thioribose-1-phosphate isomerase [bacterium]HPM98149.1 S-methyl-5-thioribose-1-phosphate isomerase [bacterium]
MFDYQTISWQNGKVLLLDQQQLPNELVALAISDYRGIVKSIQELKVRGAPAIGLAAAYGVVLSVWNVDESDRAGFIEKANQAIEEIKKTRPTAKNMFWALEQMRRVLSKNLSLPLRDIKQALLREAQRLQQDDIDRCRRIGANGAELLPNRANVLTHCNAGALATGGYGTALGVLRTARERGKKVCVYACETRPLLQGARLTTFELLEDGFDVTLITDSMAAFVMAEAKVNAVIVGADRIVANGDVANKIGTYGLAVLAQYHKIPFYVAAPLSTFDPDTPVGDQIPLEERDGDEVRRCGGQLVAPEDVAVYNPAFDVTPHQLITALVTEKGVLYPPFSKSILEKIKS